MHSADNWVLNPVILHYWHNLPILILCSALLQFVLLKALYNKGDLTWLCKKQIHHYDILVSNHHFLPKYQSIISNNASSSEKVHPLFWNHVCLICAYFCPDSDEITFSLEKAILWIEDSYFSRKQWFKFTDILMMDFVSYNTTSFTSADINWWIGVVWTTCGVLWWFYNIFYYSHSDGTHSLQRICWWANDVMLNVFKSVLMKKQTHLFSEESTFSFFRNCSSKMRSTDFWNDI